MGIKVALSWAEEDAEATALSDAGAGASAGGREIAAPAPQDAGGAGEDIQLATALLAAAEALAGSLRLPAPAQAAVTGARGWQRQHLRFATSEDLPEPDPSGQAIAEVAGRVGSLLGRFPEVSAQASLAREAFGDGETLRILFRRLFPGQQPAPAPGEDGRPVLSAREVAVLREAARDVPHAEIGRRLGITPRTVESHLRRIYDRLGVQRPMQAVGRAVAMGYLDLDVLGFVQMTASAGAGNFTRFGTLAGCAYPVDRPPGEPFRPLAEFGLLLMLLAGMAATSAVEDRGAFEHYTSALVCEVDPATGQVLRSFGEGVLWGPDVGLAVAPAHAARQGFAPGHLYVTANLRLQMGLNKAAVHEFTPDGRHVGSFCGGREVGTRLTAGLTPAFHPDGRLLVPSGALTDAILAFGRGGASVRRWAGDIVCGAVAVHGSDVYALHTSSVGNEVRAYDAAGRLKYAFGRVPPGVAYAGLAASPRDGSVWTVCERPPRPGGEDCRLLGFPPDMREGGGGRLTSVPMSSAARPGTCPAADGEGHLYIPRPHTGDVAVLSPDGGRVVRSLALSGDPASVGRMLPRAVAVGDDGRVWVSCVGESQSP